MGLRTDVSRHEYGVTRIGGKRKAALAFEELGACISIGDGCIRTRRCSTSDSDLGGIGSVCTGNARTVGKAKSSMTIMKQYLRNKSVCGEKTPKAITFRAL